MGNLESLVSGKESENSGGILMISIESREDKENKIDTYFDMAATIAKNSTCLRSKCGSIIVKEDKIIGQGFNSPPGGKELQRRCLENKLYYHKKVTDKTCCVHAEQRAIMDALRNNPSRIEGSRLYFARLDSAGKIAISGDPYCTICSKLALDAGIKEFVLWQKNGITIYDTEEYNTLSFKFGR